MTIRMLTSNPRLWNPKQNYSKKKKKTSHNDSHARESSNVIAIEVPLPEENAHMKHIKRGRSIANTKGRIVHHPYNSSYLGHENHEINVFRRENNEGCAGDENSGDPPRY